MSESSSSTQETEPRKQVRSSKIITNALCTLLEVNDNINIRLQKIQNATSEINLLREEVVVMNQKLDRLIELVEKGSNGGSTFVNYLMS